MSDLDDKKPSDLAAKPASLTSDVLADLAFETVLEHAQLLLQGGGDLSAADRMLKVMDVLTDLAVKSAKMGIVNRQHLSPLPSFDSTINPDPKSDLGDESYELRYRVVESIGADKPYRDRIFSYPEATAEYGHANVQKWWGQMGEHCPKRVSISGDRQLWFSVVRYPVSSLATEADLAAKSSTDTDAEKLLAKLTQGMGSN